MGLPEGVETRSRDAWMKIAKATEPAERKPVMAALKALGVDPVDYMQWSADAKVDFIMKAQEGGGGEEKAEKPAKGKATETTSSGGGGNAAVAELNKKVDDLTALVRDMHFLVRVLVQSNPDLNANAKDEDLQAAIYGKLAVKKGNS